MSTLTQAQRDLLVQVHDLHEDQHHGGGLSVRTALDRVVVDELIVLGLAQWHPPRAPALLIPTPLGVERVGQLRKRQEAARKGARKKRRA